MRSYGIPQRQLDQLRDLSKPLEERQALYSDVMDKVNRRAGSLGSSHFYYDPANGRIKFRGVQHIMRNLYPTQLEYFEKNLLRYGETNLDEIVEGVDRRYGIADPSYQNPADQSSSTPTFSF